MASTHEKNAATFLAAVAILFLFYDPHMAHGEEIKWAAFVGFIVIGAAVLMPAFKHMKRLETRVRELEYEADADHP